MLQLDLLDTRSGRRRSVPLADHAHVLGSSPECDLVLAVQGIAPRQCRLEPAADGMKVVDLGGDSPTRLNGQPIALDHFRPGDVLTLGPYQITLTSDEVPVPSPPAPLAPPSRRSTPAPAPEPRRATARAGSGSRGAAARVAAKPKSPALLIGGIAAGALVLVLIFIATRGGGDGDGDTKHSSREKLELARKASDEGRFDEAIRHVNDVLADRNADGRETALALEKQISDRRSRFATAKTQLDGLRDRVARDMKGETVTEVQKVIESTRDLPSLNATAVAMQQDLQRRVKKPGTPSDLSGVVLPVGRTVADCVRSADAFVAKGEFGKARFVLVTAPTTSEPERMQRKDALAKINAGARKAGDEILNRVQTHLDAGNALKAKGELDEDLLAPLECTDVWYDLLEKADEVEAKVGEKSPFGNRHSERRKRALPRPPPDDAGVRAAPEPKSPPPPAVAHAETTTRDETGESDPVRPSRPPEAAPRREATNATTNEALGLDQQARVALAEGDFARALKLLELALDNAAPAELKVQIARDHERARRPLKLAGRLAELVAARPPSSPPWLDLRDGRRGRLVRADPQTFFVDVAGSEVAAAPADVEPRSLLELSSRMPLTAEESLDRAFLALACEDRKTFLACLDKATADATNDEALKGSIDSALAFERGLERVPVRGFVRVGDRWLTWEEKAQEALTAEVREAVAGILAPKADPEKARAKLGELTSAAPAIVMETLRSERARLKAAVEAVPEIAKLERLHERAVELKRARTHALELIFDERKYFYPYHPPECPPEKAALYPEVQQEVDRRVAGVRSIWGREDSDPPEPHVTLASATVEDARQLKVLRTLLYDLGSPSDVDDQSLRAVWCLPIGTRTVHLRNFALDEQERGRLDLDARVLALNAAAQPQDEGPSREEIEQVHCTNRYRAMLGRRVLAYNDKLWSAARGHSEWMSRKGVLTHFEDDDPLRASPEQRMKLAGYKSGAGENCAVGRMGPKEALDGWCHSSGHHRNLLYESHTELGSGQSGSYWTQCFGGGREYKGNLIRD